VSDKADRISGRYFVTLSQTATKDHGPPRVPSTAMCESGPMAPCRGPIGPDRCEPNRRRPQPYRGHQRRGQAGQRGCRRPRPGDRRESPGSPCVPVRRDEPLDVHPTAIRPVRSRHTCGRHDRGLDNGVGVVGVPPGVRLRPVQVLSPSGTGTTSCVLCSIDQAIGNSVTRGVTFAGAADHAHADARNTVPTAYCEVITVSALADFDGKPGGVAGRVPRRPGRHVRGLLRLRPSDRQGGPAERGLPQLVVAVVGRGRRQGAPPQGLSVQTCLQIGTTSQRTWGPAEAGATLPSPR
jgi:subtilisin family serine protease